MRGRVQAPAKTRPASEPYLPLGVLHISAKGLIVELTVFPLVVNTRMRGHPLIRPSSSPSPGMSSQVVRVFQR